MRAAAGSYMTVWAFVGVLILLSAAICAFIDWEKAREEKEAGKTKAA